MADVKISNLPAGAAITGVEVAPVVQGGATVKTPISAILTYVQGAISVPWAQLTGVPSTFAPSAHAASHASIGSDPVTLAQSQITGLGAALAALAPLASPTFTGVPAAPTAAPGTNTTQLATTAFVAAAAGAIPYTNLTYSGLTPGAVLRATGAAAAAFGAVDLAVAAAITGILPSANGGTGVNNAGTLTNANNTTITGGGTLALAGFTLTVPATGTAALLATANTFTLAQSVVVADAATVTVTTLATFGHNSSGTPAASFGSRLLFNLASATVSDRNAAAIDTIWTTATDATRTSALLFSVVNAGVLAEALRIAGTGYTTITASGAVTPMFTVKRVASTIFFEVGGAGDASYFTGSSVSSTGAGILEIRGTAARNGAGDVSMLRVSGTAQPTSSTATHYGLRLVPIFNQTSTASGDMTVFSVEPTLTSVLGTLRLFEFIQGGNRVFSIGSQGITTILPVDAVTAASTTVVTLGHNSSGTPANGFGLTELRTLHSSTTINQSASDWTTLWATATHASRKARIVGTVYDTAAREWIRGEADGANPMLGVLGAAAVVRQTAGAATATAIWTATEQGMLQKAYDVLRLFGFMT